MPLASRFVPTHPPGNREPANRIVLVHEERQRIYRHRIGSGRVTELRFKGIDLAPRFIVRDIGPELSRVFDQRAGRPCSILAFRQFSRWDIVYGIPPPTRVMRLLKVSDPCC